MRDYKLTLNLITNDRPDSKKFKQYDTGNEIELELYKNEHLKEDERLALSNETVLAFFQRSDNVVLQKNCTIRNGNIIAKTSKDVLGVPGTLLLECLIKDGNNETTTTTVSFMVEKSIEREKAIQDDPRYYADLVTDLLNVRDNVKQETQGKINELDSSLEVVKGEINDTKPTTLSTNANITSLTGAVDGLLNLDKIYGKTLINLSKFTTVQDISTDAYVVYNTITNSSLGRTITIVNSTGRRIYLNTLKNGSYYQSVAILQPIKTVTLESAEEIYRITAAKSGDGWTDTNKNDLLKVMVLDGTVNFIPSYFEGIKSVGEDNGNKIEISTCGKNLIDLTKYKMYGINDIVAIDSANNSITFTSQWYAMFVIDIEPNTDYYVSAIRNNPGANSNLIKIYDETLATQLCSLGNNNGVFHNTAFKKVAVVLYSSNGTATTATYKNVMFIKGIAQQEYISYKQDKSEFALTNPLREWDYLDRVRNTVCIKSQPFIMDGNVTYIGNATANTFATVFYFNVDDLGEGVIKCKELPSWSTFIYGDNLGKYEGIYSAGGHIYFAIANSKTEITTSDGYDTQVAKIKAYLTNNPITIVYQTARETIEPITSKLSLNSYNSGYLAINSGAINPTIDVSYPCNIGERTKVAEDSILSLFAKLKSILPSQIIEDTLHRFMTDTERNKLNGIETNANNYTHPATHLASIINLTQGNLQTWVNNFVVQDCGNEYYILKFPGFQIHVSWSSVLQSTGVRHVNFYNAFQKCFGVVTTCSYSLTGACKPGYISNVSSTGFDLAIWDNASSGVDIAYYWIAIGR